MNHQEQKATQFSTDRVPYNLENIFRACYKNTLAKSNQPTKLQNSTFIFFNSELWIPYYIYK